MVRRNRGSTPLASTSSNNQQLTVDVLATCGDMSPRSFAEVTSRTAAKAVYMRSFHTLQTVSRQLPVNVKFGRNSGIFVMAAIPQIGKV